MQLLLSALRQPASPSAQPSATTALSAPGSSTTTPPSQEAITPGSAAGTKLTAACSLLTASEVEQVLGGGKSTTRISATEGKPDTSQADKLFKCDYGVNGKTPFTLSVGNIVESGFSATDVVDAFVKQTKTKPQAVPNLGQDAAYFSLLTGDVMLALAKRSHGELCTATFEAPNCGARGQAR